MYQKAGTNMRTNHKGQRSRPERDVACHIDVHRCVCAVHRQVEASHNACSTLRAAQVREAEDDLEHLRDGKLAEVQTKALVETRALKDILIRRPPWVDAQRIRKVVWLPSTISALFNGES